MVRTSEIRNVGEGAVGYESHAVLVDGGRSSYQSAHDTSDIHFSAEGLL